jgi:putative heme-binding domain-containing protein
VSLAVDAKGRLVIGKEKVGLLRLTLDEAGAVDRVETVNDSMKECRGLLFIGDDLYVNANESKGLYRLPARGDDQFGEPELIYESSGGVGHGRNDLTLGPDGKIYSIQGDSVNLPTNARDFTSPFRDARRGIKTSEGHLLRIDPATKSVEILAGGLRNPFGIAFNPRGDCFTYDADAEYDMGAPWYRPTRVDHLALGGDFGWRGVTQQWPPYFPDHPDNAVPGYNIGKGSPTAVKFGTQSNFPPRYRDALFILDWTYGRVIAVHAIPRGSSYLMMAETFLQGRPLNVTDLDFGLDGSMYLVTGGRATQSALYRIRYTGPKLPQPSLTKQQEYRQEIANAAHDERRRLEAELADDMRGIPAGLGSDDPWIRTAARNLLERAEVSAWREAALTEPNDKIALSALLSLARSGDKKSRSRIVERLCEVDWPAMSRSWRETAVHTLALCTEEWEPREKLQGELLSRLESVYPDREFSVNRLVSEVLVRLESTAVVSATLDLAKDATRQAEQMHYLFVIRNAPLGWTPDHRQTYFQLLAGTSDYLGGQGMNDFLTKIRSEAIESLGSDVRETLADVIQANDLNRGPVFPIATQRPIVEQWTLDTLNTAVAGVKRLGDSERGKQLFVEASCVHCHRVGGFGRLIGPDLTNVNRRFSQHDLLTSIVEPSKVIPKKYQSLQVVTTDGHIFVGITALGGDYRSTKLRLATNVLDPYAITEIEKQEIDEIRPSSTSWMPNGLLNTLTAEEVADLLAYLNASR